MVDIHESVGHLTLTGDVLLGISDSDDPGDQTNVLPAVADVTIVPSVPRVVVVANEAVVNLPTINASLNGSGQLVAPTDGKSTIGTSTMTRLIAPEQASVVPSNWYYTVTITPAAGAGHFEDIVVYLTGAPDEAKTIGGLILAGQTPTQAMSPQYVRIEDVFVLDEATGDYAVNVPEGTPEGSLLAGTNEDGQTVILTYP